MLLKEELLNKFDNSTNVHSIDSIDLIKNKIRANKNDTEDKLGKVDNNNDTKEDQGRKSLESFDDSETNYISIEDNNTVSGFDLGELTLETKETTIIGKILNNNYCYTGEITNGKRNGFGYCTFKNHEYYSGQWKNDKMEGFGRLKLSNGEIYSGEFLNNQPNGYIEQETSKAITKGLMKGFKFTEGEIIVKKRDKYTIEASIKYSGENIIGFGIINDFAGNLYEGEMLNFGPFGWGIQQKKDKFIYKGQQDRGFNGYGEVYCVDGSKYFGFFKNNKKHGVVVNFNVKEERISFAKYSEDSKNGATLNVHKNGLKVEIWHNGYRVKLIENFDLAKKYINTCYPEHEWILNLDYMNMINYFGKLNCK